MKKNIPASSNYKWQYFLVSFGTKIFLTIGIPILLFLVVLFLQNYSTVSNDLANRYIMAAESEVEGLLTSFNSIQSTFTSNSDLQKYLLSQNHDAHSAGYVNQFDNDTINFCVANPAIQSIYIYRCSDDYIIAAGNNPPTSNYAGSFSDKNYAASDVKRQKYLEIRQMDFGNRTRTVLTCNYPVYYHALLAGFISINVDANVLQENLLQILPKNSKITVLHDEQPLMRFPSDLDIRSFSNKYGYSANLLTGNINISGDIKGQNLTIILNYNQNDSTANIFINSKLFLMFVVFLLLLFILLAYLLTSQYYKAMASIIIKSTSTLDWYGVNTSISSKDYDLSRSNKKVEIELNERLATFRDLQFKFLQTQISPHFLFNALNVISMMDLEIFKKQTQIGKSVRLLSDILRYSITGSDFMSPFSSELDYSLKYLELQNKRYGNKIKCKCNIEPGVDDIKIIKFTLQPIIENAIRYAVLDSEICQINIIAKLSGRNLVIDIANNGTTLNETELAELNRTLASGKLNSSHTSGLLNVNKRIKLIYGESYGCKMLQTDSDTHLIIEIPSE